MSTYQRQTYDLFANGRTMINGFPADYSTTSSTEEIGHRRRKKHNLDRKTKNRSADKEEVDIDQDDGC